MQNVSPYTTSFIGSRLNSKSNDFHHSVSQNTVVSKHTSETSENNSSQNKDLKELLREHSMEIDAPMNNVNYFTDTPTTLYIEQKGTQTYPPEGFLVEPYARKGTSKTIFGMAPCGGGLKGQSKYVASPGDKAKVEWIIKNPVKGGL